MTARKYTVILLDRELAEHETMVFHVKASDPLDAVRAAFAEYFDEIPDDGEKASQMEFALDMLQVLHIFPGHIGDATDDWRGVESLIRKMRRAATRAVLNAPPKPKTAAKTRRRAA